MEFLERRLLLTVPAVVSIDRVTPLATETNAASVSYAVTFNEPVTLVASGDFLVTTTGSLETATPVIVSGSGSAYTVTVNGIHGSGVLRLDLVDDDSILGPLGAGDPLGGVGAGNGSFQGQTYTVDQVSPFVVSINLVSPEVPVFSATSISYTVTFSEPVTGVDPTDFTLALTGSLTTTTPLPLTILGSDAVYTVTIDGLAGEFTLGLNLTDDGSIRDGAGNLLSPSDPLDWSFVGDPGNLGQLSGISVPGGGGPNVIVGAVDYAYRIGTYEVTNSQYAVFLNAKDPTGANALGLYSASLGTDTINGGITFDNSRIAGSKYAVMSGHGNLPVSYVTWYSTIRFANWTNNGQGDSDTESGAYTLLGGTPTPTNATTIARNPTARAFLPSENEWHKAAYYNPLTQTYFRYATGSGILPNYLLDPQDSNAANYTPGGWPNPDYNLAIGHVTDVGAFASSPSPYGTFDQSGNVWEWTEATILVGSTAFRAMRGGTYSEIWDHLTAAYRGSGPPDGDYVGVGFRLASIADLNANFTGQVFTDDLTPPAVTSITTPDANPTGALVVHYTVTFSERVTGVDVTDFVLVASGEGVNASIVNFYGSGSTYTVVAMMTLNSSAHGTLGLNLVDNDSIIDRARNPLGGAGNGTLIGQSYTISRDGYNGPFLFYRESSRYDTTGNPQAGLPFSDDNAIATDKTAYLPGSGAATFANVSSYFKGINGIMVDIPPQHGTITADDFVFKVGNNNSPNAWATAPAPTTVSVRSGAGVDGSDRIELMWANNAIQKQWLQVIVNGNDTLGGNNTNTGLASSDVFYFGHSLGDTGLGDTAVNATVNAIDEGGTRNNPQVAGNNIPITNLHDFNRDGRVNAIDEAITRNNATNSATVLKYLNLADPPAAPQSDGGGGGDPSGGDAGVASALTAPAPASPEARVPRWLGLRLDEVDLSSGRVAEVFQSLHDFNTPTARKLLLRADRVAEALNLDHELLDSLLADLGIT